jgi:hypothetical protein
MEKLWILAVVAALLVGDLCHSQEHYGENLWTKFQSVQWFIDVPFQLRRTV